MTNRSSLVFSLVALFLTACLAGCGNNNSSSSSSTQSNANGSSGNAVTVQLTGNDTMRYNKTEFTVPSGATVKLEFENVGKLPITAMGHDVVILKKGEDSQQFGQKIATASGSKNADHIPADMMDQVLAHTKILGPGQKETVTFTAPAPGTYDYLCTFPGHYITMHGQMIVK